MGNTITTNSQSYIPQEIRETNFFQECVSRLPELSHGNVDHVGVYECEMKTGELLADRKWIREQKQYKSLEAYTGKVLKLDFSKLQVNESILFSKSALVFLKSGKSLFQSCQMAYGFQNFVRVSGAESYVAKAAKAELVPEVVKVIIKPEQKEATEVSQTGVIKIETAVIHSTPRKSSVIARFEKGLKQLTPKEMKSLQENCVYIFAKYLMSQGMDSVKAKQNALAMLGTYGVDSKYGTHTRQLVGTVASLLVDQKKMDISQMKDASSLAHSIQDVLLNDEMQETVKEIRS